MSFKYVTLSGRFLITTLKWFGISNLKIEISLTADITVERYETIGKDCVVPLAKNSERMSLKEQSSAADSRRVFAPIGEGT